MLFAVILLSMVGHAEPVLSWEDGLKKCEQQTRWGYFKHLVIPALGGPASVWGTKDLYGKFKTKEECSADRERYEKREWGKPCKDGPKGCRKGPAEECEPFVAGKSVYGTIFQSIRKNLDDKGSIAEEVNFSDENRCLEAVENGGTFNGRYTQGSSAQSGVKFISKCEKRKLIVCERDQPPIVYSDLN